MKETILLIHTQKSEKIFASSPYVQLSKFPQLGLLYLSSILQKNGFHTKYLDIAINSKDEIFNYIRDQNNILFIGLYSNIALREDICSYIKEIKQLNDTTIIIGGPGYFEYNYYFEAGADAVFAGEADDSIVEIAKSIHNNKNLPVIPGLISKSSAFKNIKVLSNQIFDLSNLPLPNWKDAPPEYFYNYLSFFTKHPFYSIITSRGCPMKCAFCFQLYQNHNKKYRLRQVDDVIQEIIQLKQVYKIKHIKFQDDSFGAKKSWIIDFCTKMIDLNLKINWNCSLFPTFFSGNDSDYILSLMRKAGCVCIHFGLQSAHPDILRSINRDPKEPEILYSLIPRMKKMGYFTIVDFIYGLPNETSVTLKENFNFSIKSGVHIVQINPFIIVPGTELYDKYGDNYPKHLSDFEITKAIKKTNKKFFFNFKTILRNCIYIIKYNPLFLINFFHILPFMLKFLFGKFKIAKWQHK